MEERVRIASEWDFGRTLLIEKKKKVTEGIIELKKT